MFGFYFLWWDGKQDVYVNAHSEYSKRMIWYFLQLKTLNPLKMYNVHN